MVYEVQDEDEASREDVYVGYVYSMKSRCPNIIFGDATLLTLTKAERARGNHIVITRTSEFQCGLGPLCFFNGGGDASRGGHTLCLRQYFSKVMARDYKINIE